MYCPKCNQPQVSDDVRFCSRCGFRLDVVSELLKNEGALTVRTGELSPRTERRRRTMQGAKLMFISGVLLPLAIALSIPMDSPAPLLVPFTVFLAGLFWMLYFLIFGEEAKAAGEAYGPPQVGQSARDYALPPPRSVPASDFTRSRHRTAEMAQPPSVTENTTKLLDQD